MEREALPWLLEIHSTQFSHLAVDTLAIPVNRSMMQPELVADSLTILNNLHPDLKAHNLVLPQICSSLGRRRTPRRLLTHRAQGLLREQPVSLLDHRTKPGPSWLQ